MTFSITALDALAKEAEMIGGHRMRMGLLDDAGKVMENLQRRMVQTAAGDSYEMNELSGVKLKPGGFFLRPHEEALQARKSMLFWGIGRKFDKICVFGPNS